MTTLREDIIRMAQEAGFPEHRAFSDLSDLYPRLERFAALVAAAERKRLEATAWGASKKWIVEAVAAEREECAKVCDFEVARLHAIDEPRPALAVGICAAAIRARGQP